MIIIMFPEYSLYYAVSFYLSIDDYANNYASGTFYGIMLCYSTVNRLDAYINVSRIFCNCQTISC